jgi:hypothetical protein
MHKAGSLVFCYHTYQGLRQPVRISSQAIPITRQPQPVAGSPFRFRRPIFNLNDSVGNRLGGGFIQQDSGPAVIEDLANRARLCLPILL